MRLFVAIPVEKPALSEVIAQQRGLKRLNLIQGNFIKKENIHVTLCFVGEIDKSLLSQVIEALSSVKFPVFAAELEGLGYLPSHGRRLSHIYVGLNGGLKLSELSYQINVALNSYVSLASRPFLGHITLVRVKEAKAVAKIKAYCQETRVIPEKLLVNNFVLYRSHLTHSGSQYEVVERFFSSNF